VSALVTNVVRGSGAERLMLLAHGFGADERDLGGLLPYLDPGGTFAVVLPRAPEAAGEAPGFSWFDMFGRTDPATAFAGAVDLLDDLLDEACTEHGFDRSGAIVGGFSQGAGLALAVALRSGGRPRPAGVLAMSPFVPAVELLGIDPSAVAPPVLVQHGSQDPLVPVQRSRDLVTALRGAAVPTVYREYPMQHQVALESLQDARDWLGRVLEGDRPDEEPAPPPVELIPPVTTAQWQTEVVESPVPVVVDFWAPWCGPCRQVAPVLEQMAIMRRGSYKFVKVNIDEEPALAQNYDVQSIPMVGLIRDGRLAARSVGAKPRQQIEAELGMLVLP
jgi:thioredoxin